MMAVNKAKLASEILGLRPGGGELQKLFISYKYGKGLTGRAEALFNPSELTFSRSVEWEAQEVAQQSGTWKDIKQRFVGVKPETLSIELFFDTYAPATSGGMLKQTARSVIPPNPFQKPGSRSVKVKTDEFIKLARVDSELHQPPICHLHWGTFGSGEATGFFVGVLTDVRQKFTLFLADGTPVRATLSCTFTESTTEAHIRAGEVHSADVVKTRQVRRNDTLHSLAAEEYNDPSLWRHIAKANGIVNPRDLPPGTVLIIPKLRP